MAVQYNNLNLRASHLEPTEKILRAAIGSWNHAAVRRAVERRARVFVTVSRQPGAGGISFSHRLAQMLNLEKHDDWTAWDRELVEKVSSDHGIAREIIEMIPSRKHNWLDDMLQSISVSHNPADMEEARAYKRVAMTIQALAAAGHAIIVGQGGAFITENMPAAIHLRLVAPLEHRIKYTSERDQISLHQAAAQIDEIDRARAQFYHRYWPNKTVGPEAFTMTLNSAELSVDELVECVLPLIRSRQTAEHTFNTSE